MFLIKDIGGAKRWTAPWTASICAHVVIATFFSWSAQSSNTDVISPTKGSEREVTLLQRTSPMPNASKVDFLATENGNESDVTPAQPQGTVSLELPASPTPDPGKEEQANGGSEKDKVSEHAPDKDDMRYPKPDEEKNEDPDWTHYLASMTVGDDTLSIEQKKYISDVSVKHDPADAPASSGRPGPPATPAGTPSTPPAEPSTIKPPAEHTDPPVPAPQTKGLPEGFSGPAESLEAEGVPVGSETSVDKNARKTLEGDDSQERETTALRGDAPIKITARGGTPSPAHAEWWAPGVTRQVSKPRTTPSATRAQTAPVRSRARVAAHPRSDSRKRKKAQKGSENEKNVTLSKMKEPNLTPPTESIEDLRASLGIHTPTANGQGAVVRTFQRATTDHIVAMRTEDGEYRKILDEIISSNWMAQDLPHSSQASGLQGATVVDFIIKRSGRVSRLHLRVTSGHKLLDEIALNAVPKRLPRIPKSLKYRKMKHRYIFHYINPALR